MRLEKAQKLFDLARELAAARHGLTLADMQAKLGAGRRTAERFRDALDAMLGLEAAEDGGQKRWRLGTNHVPIDVLTRVNAEELAELAAAEALLRTGGFVFRAETLARLRQKIETGIRPRVATDLAAGWRQRAWRCARGHDRWCRARRWPRCGTPFWAAS